MEDVNFPDTPKPGEEFSAVALLDDGSKLYVDPEGNYAPVVELGELRNPCPQAGGVLAWFMAEGEPGGMMTRAARYAENGVFTGPVDYLSFSGENVMGTDILAAKDGKVSRVYEDARHGHVVELDHGDGYTSSYGHCGSITVKAGEPVKAGQPIATLGDSGFAITGPHLSFWLRLDGDNGRLDGSVYRFAEMGV
jgi:murein DD-endopeptidase MepM/ murein hydrolase activator NlpD